MFGISGGEAIQIVAFIMILIVVVETIWGEP
jgi:hypothetical protein